MNVRTMLCDMPTDVKGYVVRKDGYFTIVLNARLDYEQNKKTFMHEIEHIKRNDFDSNMSAGFIEVLAHKM